MIKVTCSNCKKTNSVSEDLAYVYCQYCGQKIMLDSTKSSIQKDIENILAKKDPKEIYDELIKLDQKFPNNIDIKRAILMQGRLHERNPKKLDYSVIHCYLLNVFLEDELFKGQKQKFIDELISSPKLLDCLNICENKNLFLQKYYFDISTKYIELFLMGSSKYMKQFFGLSFSRNPAKTLAYPCSKIIKNILSETKLGQFRYVLAKSFYEAFANKFGDTVYINEELGDTKNLIIGDYIHLDI